MATTSSLADRYGRGRPRRARLIYWSLLVLFVVAGLVVAYLGYHNLGSNPIDAEVTSYHVIDEHTISVSFTVTRDHPDRAADCILDAPAADGAEAGRREVYVPANENGVLHTELRTTQRATNAEFFGCSYQVPSYLNKSAGH